MMRWWVFLLLGVLSYLTFLLANLPASQGISWLAANGLPLSTNDTRGTIWRGQAAKASYNNINLGATKWRFRPLGLFQGSIQYDVILTDPGQNLSGSTSYNFISGEYELDEINGRIEADIIPKLINQTYVRTTGKLDINLQQASFTGRQPTSATGDFRWIDAGIKSPVKAQLGDLQFLVSSSETGLQIDVKDLDGQLKLDGRIDLAADGKYKIKGKVKPNNSANSDLGGLLGSLGRRQADGSTLIDYSGQL